MIIGILLFKKQNSTSIEKISHTNFKDLKSYLDENIEKLYKEALEIVKKIGRWKYKY